MVSVGIQPDASKYSTLIDGYFKKRMVDAVLSLFKEMSGMTAKPDTLTYGIVRYLRLVELLLQRKCSMR
jgi:pentatricopeptide repeat protein